MINVSASIPTLNERSTTVPSTGNFVLSGSQRAVISNKSLITKSSAVLSLLRSDFTRSVKSGHKSESFVFGLDKSS